jgi:inorganic phosphate transporter, PiT family
MLIVLFLATCFLAYSNGANDNFKGVASLFGSKTASYKTCISWATLTTFAGSICAVFFAQALLRKFSGKGLVPEQIVGSEAFLLSLAFASGLTVILATMLGFPVSTTHALTGAIIGAGLVAVGNHVNFAALGIGFLLPLIVSPVLAVLVGAAIYLLLRYVRLRCGIGKEWCLCFGEQSQIIAIPQPHSLFALEAQAPQLQVTVGQTATCSLRYSGTFVGVNSQKAMDAAHFISAGIVSFARGLNDTPKIAAMLSIIPALNIKWGLVVVGIAMAVGGLLNARKVAETMSHKITRMNHGQGFSANVATGLLVIAASNFGLPVSTTHVSVGALFGIGLTTRQANLKVISGILLSWILTLPCAAVCGAVSYWTLRG